MNIIYLAMLLSLANSQEINFQNRGDYSEGIKPKSLVGHDIQVSSLHSLPVPEIPKNCETLNVAFYLEEVPRSGARIDIFDHTETYYKFEKELEPTELKKGLNTVSWPAKIFNNIRAKSTDLNFRINIRGMKRTELALEEKLAPAIFSCGKEIDKTLGEVETILKTGTDARLNLKVEGEEKSEVYKRVPGGHPQKINLSKISNATNVRVDFGGFELSTNQPLHQSLIIYAPKSSGAESRKPNPSAH